MREVVAELAINPNTALKAYRELEHKGLDEDGVAALFESTLRDFPERATADRTAPPRKSAAGESA